MAEDPRVTNARALKTATDAWATKETIRLQSQVTAIKFRKISEQKVALRTTKPSTDLSFSDVEAFLKI